MYDYLNLFFSYREARREYMVPIILSFVAKLFITGFLIASFVLRFGEASGSFNSNGSEYQDMDISFWLYLVSFIFEFTPFVLDIMFSIYQLCSEKQISKFYYYHNIVRFLCIWLNLAIGSAMFMVWSTPSSDLVSYKGLAGVRLLLTSYSLFEFWKECIMPHEMQSWFEVVLRDVIKLLLVS